ncbi:hypothetical protein J2129_000016 [Methanofollis sp. W23]|nr:hypothetical protein [Methanofollis sp. W23]
MFFEFLEQTEPELFILTFYDSGPQGFSATIHLHVSDHQKSFGDVLGSISDFEIGGIDKDIGNFLFNWSLEKCMDL